jgi:hypothetical protein
MTEEQISYCRQINPASLAGLPFRKQIFPDITNSEIAEQANLQLIAARKLPAAWLENNIFIADRQAIEQCTSALVAVWKKSLVPKDVFRFGDACAGIGSDAFHLSEQIEELYLFENHPLRAAALRRNAPIIRQGKCWVTEGSLAPEHLRELAAAGKNFMLYADPDRREEGGRRLRGWENFRPDILPYFDILRTTGSKMLLKLSPLEDPEALAPGLPGLSAVYLVSVHNEVKEVLFYFDFDMDPAPVRFEAVELRRSGEIIRVRIPVELDGNALPGNAIAGNYLLDPLASIRKGRFASCLAEAEGWKRLSSAGRLYSSENIPEHFPGRIFRIEGVYDSPSSFRKNFRGTSCHVVSRDFPADAEEIRKKLQLKEEGDHFLFCFKDDSGKRRVVLHCLRMG